MPPTRTAPPPATPADDSRYADRALEALRQGRMRITRPRRSIVELLERAGEPLTASGVHEALRRRRIAVDLASVYRTLTVLESHGLIHRLGAIDGVVRCEPGFERAACHHHAICRSCGKVKELTCDPHTRLPPPGAEQAGFLADAHVVELVGLCAACRPAKA